MKRCMKQEARGAAFLGWVLTLAFACLSMLGGARDAEAALIADGRIDVAVLNQTSRDASFWQEANLAATLRTAPGSTPFRLAYVAPGELGAAGLQPFDVLVIPTEQRAFLTDFPEANAAIAAWVQGGGVLIVAPGNMPSSLLNDPLMTSFGAGYNLGWGPISNDMSDYYCFDGVPRGTVKTLRPLSATEPLVHVPNELGSVFTACDRAILTTFGSKYRVVASSNSFRRPTGVAYVKYELVAAAYGQGAVVVSPASFVLNSLGHQQLAENLFRAAKIPPDTTPPTVAIGATPALTALASLTVRGSALDIGGVGYTLWKLDGNNVSTPAPDAAGNTSETFTLVEGTNTITLTATDLSGNSASASATVILDTTAPIVALDPGALLTNDPTYTFAGSIIDTGTGVSLVRMLRNGEVVATAAPGPDGAVSATIRLVEGTNALTLEATDLAGNVSSAVREVELDTTPPVVAIGALPAFTNQTQIDVRGMAHDASGIASATLIVNGVVLAHPTLDEGGALLVPAIALVDGRNTIVLQVADGAGNSAAAQVEIGLDTVPPELAIVSPSAGQVFGSSSVAVTIAVTDSTDTTVVLGELSTLLEGGSGRITSTIELPTEGPTTLEVTATDAAGNVSTTSVEVLLDFTAPVVTTELADGAKLGPLDEDLLALTLHVDDLSATTVAIGGGSYALAQGGGVVQVTLPLVEGENLLIATITDEAGHVTTVTRSVVYDVTPPQGSFDTPAEGSKLRVSADLSVFAKDELSGVVSVIVHLDGGAAIELARADESRWVGSIDTTTLSDGLHTATAELRDGVGNSVTLTTTFTVDNTPPTVTLVSPSDAQMVAGEISIVAQASDASSGVSAIAIAVNGTPVGRCEGEATCTVTFSTLGLPDGPFRITASAMDNAGNEAITAQISATADNSAPAKFLLAPLSGSIVSGSTPLTVSIDDPAFASVACTLSAATALTPSPLATPDQAAFSAPIDTLALLDGPALARCVASDLAGNTGIETASFTVKNWYVQLSPRAIDIRVKQSSSVIEMWAAGNSVPQLWPTAPYGLTLNVPCGSPLPLLPDTAAPADVPQIPGWSLMKLRFDRPALIAALKASVASGCIDKDRPVTAQVVSRGQTIASDQLSLYGF
jgi:hypothetical protein